MAPWTHTYLSPQTERRMCCASREPARMFRQYIDTQDGTGEYEPQTLEQHWNSEHMRSVRRRMMSGQDLPECEVCDNKLLNTSVYRDYFWHLFGDRYQDIWTSTDHDGTTTMQPVSWDYRFSNLCNFRCRHCGDMLSSSWESEQRQHQMINWQDPKNNWMKPQVRKKIAQFQTDQVELEFARAVEEHRVEEIYWVGGEPLMYDIHWWTLEEMLRNGSNKNCYMRYNSNLSRVQFGQKNLFDYLPRFKDWMMCASIDGTGEIVEYIRTGIKWNEWLANFKEGVSLTGGKDKMKLEKDYKKREILRLKIMI